MADKKKINKKPTKPVKDEPVKAEKVKKTNALHLDLYDVTGKIVGEVNLPEEIFGVKPNNKIVAQAVRVYLANQRSGSASTKTRGEVTGSTRKIYRQKGTGRARHGGVRAPIFVHGGVAHGPKPKDFSLKMPQKMRRVALISVLSSKVKDGSIKVVDGLEKIEPKTKAMSKLLDIIKGDGKKGKTLLVLDGKHDPVTRSARNIDNVRYEFATQLNTYEVMTHQNLILMHSAIEVIQKTFAVKEKVKAGKEDVK